MCMRACQCVNMPICPFKLQHGLVDVLDLCMQICVLFFEMFIQLWGIQITEALASVLNSVKFKVDLI